MTTLGRWAADSERAGFAAVGVIDRLVYENLDPLSAFTAAASCTLVSSLRGGRARDRTGRGRWVDVATKARKAARHQQSQASRRAVRRAVDAPWTPRLVVVALLDNERS
jgi:hypothetical protein